MDLEVTSRRFFLETKKESPTQVVILAKLILKIKNWTPRGPCGSLPCTGMWVQFPRLATGYFSSIKQKKEKKIKLV